ncbi:hypothetical protein ACX84Q_33615, partial [Burkholderia pseudomallei]
MRASIDRPCTGGPGAMPSARHGFGIATNDASAGAHPPRRIDSPTRRCARTARGRLRRAPPSHHLEQPR